jgi:hypothetical protein
MYLKTSCRIHWIHRSGSAFHLYSPYLIWINRSIPLTYPQKLLNAHPMAYFSSYMTMCVFASSYSPGTSLMVHYAFNACVATVSIKWGSFVFLYSRVMRVPRNNFPWRMPFYIKGAKMPTFHCGAACISPGSECAQLRVLVKSPMKLSV